MKIETTIELPPKKSNAPYLIRHKDSKFVVLATQFPTPNSGFVVDGAELYCPGASHDWNFVSHPQDWEVLPAGSSVTLTQE